jgi:hypothetical protein
MLCEIAHSIHLQLVFAEENRTSLGHAKTRAHHSDIDILKIARPVHGIDARKLRQFPAGIPDKALTWELRRDECTKRRPGRQVERPPTHQRESLLETSTQIT